MSTSPKEDVLKDILLAYFEGNEFLTERAVKLIQQFEAAVAMEASVILRLKSVDPSLDMTGLFVDNWKEEHFFHREQKIRYIETDQLDINSSHKIGGILNVDNSQRVMILSSQLSDSQKIIAIARLLDQLDTKKEPGTYIWGLRKKEDIQ